MSEDLKKISKFENEIAVLKRFPDQNPNPVLKISASGILLYFNPASSEIIETWSVQQGELVPEDIRDLINGLIKTNTDPAPELSTGEKTFILNMVYVPEFDFINIYATDITAAKLVTKFPEQNPNPVLKVSIDGKLIFANKASNEIISCWKLSSGEYLPEEMLGHIKDSLNSYGGLRAEVEVDNKTFAFNIVPVSEFGFINIYGTDITASKVITKFPEQNPNPVLKVSENCQLIYANAASGYLLKEWRIKVGDKLPPRVEVLILRALAFESKEPVYVYVGDKVFSFSAVSVKEFSFINIYGTDITASKELEVANKENERLLLNILPVSIAERLKKGEKVIADKIDQVTILFADLVGFTSLATKLPPREVVELLNSVFSEFDLLLERFSLEKIKTIGDAYMVAGGLDKKPESYFAVAEMALAMQEKVKELNKKVSYDVELRMGIHTGPVVAGVIGLKKFIYDVWGDAVNTASRMESHGIPGKIQVSGQTFELLKESFKLSERGEIDIKGKGRLVTYFLES